MREKKFNFIPAHQTGTQASSSDFRVTITTTPARAISFPTSHPDTQTFIGKYLQFFIDPSKRALGWKVFESGELGDLQHAYKVTQYEYKKDGKVLGRFVRVGANTALKNLGVIEKSITKVPVYKYKETGVHADGKTIYYVELAKTHA